MTSVFLGLILILPACKYKGETDLEPKNPEANTVKMLSELHSGYESSTANWGEFLSCWDLSMRKTLGYAESVERGLLILPKNSQEVSSISTFFLRPDDAQNFKLPRSYLDFIDSYLKMGGGFVEKKVSNQGFLGWRISLRSGLFFQT